MSQKMIKPTSKLARPSGLSQARASPVDLQLLQAHNGNSPHSGKAQAALEKSARAAGLSSTTAEQYAARLLSSTAINKAADSASIDPCDLFKIGDRVFVGGVKPGIIAFIGEVQFGVGDWAGVVLDTPDGKNDGSVSGVRYFQCEPRRGIFSKLSKLSFIAKPSTSTASLSSNSTNTTDESYEKLTPGSDDGVSIARTSSAAPATKQHINSPAMTASSDRLAHENASHSSDSPAGLIAQSQLEDATMQSSGIVPVSSQSIPVGMTQSTPDQGSAAGSTTQHMTPKTMSAASSTSHLPRRTSIGSHHSSQGSINDIPACLDPQVAAKYSFVVGDRVRISGCKIGTLRYLGQTDFAKGVWAGVELDGPLGKNDGSVAGKRYFACQPLYGLFAPMHKVENLRGVVASTPRRGSRDVLGSRERGSQESISSIGSATSTASRGGGRMRLGITSLGSQTSKGRTPTSVAPNIAVLQKALKEKEEHVEQLIRERDLERSEFTRAAAQMDELDSMNSSLKAEHLRYVRDTEELVRKLKISLEAFEQEKLDLFHQIQEEKRKVEDLQFSLEEATIEKTDIESRFTKNTKTIQELEEQLKRVSHAKAGGDASSHTLGGGGDNEEFYLDQIEELTHKLSVAENQIKSMQSASTPTSDNLCNRCRNTDQGVANSAGIASAPEIERLQGQLESIMSEKTASDIKLTEAEKKLSDLTAKNNKLSADKERLTKENFSLLTLQKDNDRRLNELKKTLESSEASFKEQLEESQSKYATLTKSWELDREVMQQSMKQLTEEKDGVIKALKRQLESLKKEGSPLRKTDAEDNRELKQRIVQLEQSLRERSADDSDIAGNPISTDINLAQLLSEKEAAESQVEFLNSVIVEIQRKNVELETRLEAMDPRNIVSNSKDNHNTSSRSGAAAPRLFCDICDVFDMHDTDDCPQQDMSSSPPTSQHHGSRTEERPYCATCEVFGHATDKCSEEQTF